MSCPLPIRRLSEAFTTWLLTAGARLVLVAAAGIPLSLVASLAHANLILNGDIENNTASDTMLNMSNATFNATVADATAFGTGNEIDLLTGFEELRPQSGNWMLGLNQRSSDSTKIDAFSFDLSAPIVSGDDYALEFFAAGAFFGNLGPVEIGLSSSGTSFGTPIFSGTPTGTTSWSQFNHAFVAPVNASFLTVRVTPQLGGMFAFVDNFTLVPEPSTALLHASALGVLAALAVRRRRAL